MDLVITAVQGHGDQTQERVQLDATGACQLGDFMVGDTTYGTNGGISNKVRHTHWFLDQQLNKGDTVLLYTRSGTTTKTQRPNGTVVHHVFWGLGRPIWNDGGDAAVLWHIDTWSPKKVK
jgi:hypothetical protein